MHGDKDGRRLETLLAASRLGVSLLGGAALLALRSAPSFDSRLQPLGFPHIAFTTQ